MTDEQQRHMSACARQVIERFGGSITARDGDGITVATGERTTAIIGPVRSWIIRGSVEDTGYILLAWQTETAIPDKTK